MLSPEWIALDFGLTLLSSSEIKERAFTFTSEGVDYLIVRSIKEQDAGAVVSVSAVQDRDTCFGGYHRRQLDFTYSAKRDGEEWKVKLIANPPLNLVDAVDAESKVKPIANPSFNLVVTFTAPIKY